MITVAETAPFQRKSAALLSSKEKDGLIAYLADHPSAGDLIQGTGGVRKIRWARGGRGKSSGVRVIYYYHNNAAVPTNDLWKEREIKYFHRGKAFAFRLSERIGSLLEG